ncbi:MAG: GTPase-associated system all-helical protein GASH, partial [Terriglobia bacterium]
REALDRHLRVDREELQILWWVFGCHSTTVDKPFHAIDVCQRAIAAGSELAELVIVPPARGSSQFLHAVLKEDRQLTLRQLIEPCGPDVLQSVARRSGEVDPVLKAHPSLLPLMWLSVRRIESGMASGWEAECEQRTHVSPNEDRAASTWAVQVFNECVAARLLVASNQEEEEE